MNNLMRNFLRIQVLHSHMTVWMKALSTSFQLRSLSGASPTEIPGRYSSSSLPPFFVTGRFAVFCFPARRMVMVQGV